MKLKHLNVNKSPGPDNIHPRILSEASEILALPLKILFETLHLKSKNCHWTGNQQIFQPYSKKGVN